MASVVGDGRGSGINCVSGVSAGKGVPSPRLALLLVPTIKAGDPADVMMGKLASQLLGGMQPNVGPLFPPDK